MSELINRHFNYVTKCIKLPVNRLMNFQGLFWQALENGQSYRVCCLEVDTPDIAPLLGDVGHRCNQSCACVEGGREGGGSHESSCEAGK